MQVCVSFQCEQTIEHLLLKSFIILSHLYGASSDNLTTTINTAAEPCIMFSSTAM